MSYSKNKYKKKTQSYTLTSNFKCGSSGKMSFKLGAKQSKY